MYATIQSTTNTEFDALIKADPVDAFKNVLVYELVDSAFPYEIIKKIAGRQVAKFRHLALDTTGNCYLFDIEKKKLDGRIGPCIYILD